MSLPDSSLNPAVWQGDYSLGSRVHCRVMHWGTYESRPTRIAALALSMVAGVAHGLPPPERVRFESVDRNDRRPLVIEGLLYRPVDAPRDRPAIIALHGCGGLYSAARGRESQLIARHASHAESWLATGYVVLFVDSLGPRGLRELCTIRSSDRPVNPARRRLDALGALRWLAAQPGVARDRIALVGWSHGGSTVLATIDAGYPDVVRFRGSDNAPLFFRGAIAFYPACAPVSRNLNFRPAVPTRILIGAADDWTPAEPCERLAARARDEGWPLETTVYARAHHGFDAPRGKVVHRVDVPNGVNPGQGVHVGPEPEARADAIRKVAAFLGEVLDR